MYFWLITQTSGLSLKQLIINLRHRTPQSLIMELRNFCVETIWRNVLKNDIKKCRWLICFSAAIQSVTPAELIRKEHVTVAEKESCGKSNKDFGNIHCHGRAFSWWCDLISNSIVTRRELKCRKDGTSVLVFCHLQWPFSALGKKKIKQLQNTVPPLASNQQRRFWK